MSHSSEHFKPTYVAPWEAKEIRIALVLGGGGVKGAAHVGIIEILQKNKIPVDLVIGSSMGSFVAACFAYYQEWDVLLDKFKSTRLYDMVDISFFNVLKMLYSKVGLCQGDRFYKMIGHQLPDDDLLTLEIPTIIMGTDIETFLPCEIKTGSIVTAVRASTAIPPYYAPVELGGRMMIDGGICSPLPNDVARKYGAKIVIASDLSCSRQINSSNMVKTFYESLNQSYYHLSKFQRRYADICIRPVLDFPTFGEVDYNLIYEAGKKEALKALPQIHKLLETL